MGKKVICERCNGEVTQEYDLVTDTNVLSVVAYHVECYGKDLRQGKAFFLGNEPLNGKVFNFITILSVILSTILFFTINFFYGLLPLPLLFYRGYSFFVYERPIKRKKN